MKSAGARKGKAKVIALAVAGALLLVCLAIAFGQMRGSFFQTRPRRVSTSHGTEITVKRGDNLQDAIEAARPGDTIIVEAGATFIGPFTLPAKTGGTGTDSDYITIRTSASDAQLPPAGTRITPSSSALLPKLVSPGKNQPAVQTDPSAHHYKLIGLEIAPQNASVYLREIVRLGDGSSAQNSLSLVPHHLILDRCYIHAFPTQDTIRAIALNSAETSIINSYISEIHSKGFDSQAVWGWNGPGPFHIINNYLEASGENAGFGGSDPAIPKLIPSDIEFRKNSLTKPLSWRGAWMVKNLFELKNAQRMVIDGNVFEYCWPDAQAGFAIQLTVRNQDGKSPWSTIRDIEFTNNIVRHVSSAINILGFDSTEGYASQQMQRVRIANNLFDDVSASKWGGDGIFLQVTTAANLTVDHNTVIHTGTDVNAFATVNNLGPSPNFVMTNNVMAHNLYGIFGSGMSPGMVSLNSFFPRAIVKKNLIAGADAKIYPPDNFYLARIDDAKFVDRARGNYRLTPSSSLRGKATDGKDVGCDFDQLAAALAKPEQLYASKE
ncbi:MAG: hypothetical protein WCB68_05315 [Pyrinomonadaceae bacterium]